MITTAKTKKLEAALRYARRGWPVLPVHSVQNGRCTCGSNCEKAGKHPRTQHGINDATTDTKRVRAWFAEWPAANVAIATGHTSGLLVLDVDRRHGGYKSLKELVDKERRPRTPTVRTGGGGLHMYFKLPDELQIRSRNGILPGLEIKAERGSVIAPPSLHASGKYYRWLANLTPSDVEPAPIPSWLKHLLSKSKNESSDNGAPALHAITEGQRHDFLLRMAGALRRQGATPEDIAGALLVVNQNRCERPLPEKEVLTIGRSTEAWTPTTAGVDPLYEANEDGISWLKPTKDGAMPIRLTNFDARIVADIVEDDGVETRRHCEIETNLRGRKKRFVIPALTFMAMSWPVEHLGAKAVVSPGMGLRDHARAAIQELSADQAKERQVFAHSGWRKYHGRHVYLHSGGAIDQHGQIVDIKVKLPSSLSSLSLPPPPDGEALRCAVCASLEFLKIGPRAVTFPIYAGIWRAPLGQCDFSECVMGQTGVGKTVLAALAQQHYGAGFSERNLPGSWSSTGNANEGLAFTAKDALLVVDDFAPTGTRGDLARYNKEADRILRAQGNSSGRLRMKSDSTLRNSKPPRGLILSTGEDTPRGQSLRARMLILELSPDGLDWERVTRCQCSAGRGLYAQAMAGYLRWLAPRYSEIRENMPERISSLRADASGSQQHRRTPEIVANLTLGMRYFLRFAQSVGAVSAEEADELEKKSWRALGAAARVQDRYQRAENPALRFVELIRSALATGRAHLADAETGDSNKDTGECIGWTSGDCVLLDPDVAFATAQKLAQDQGEFIAIGQKTLWQRMRDRGLLVRSDAQRNLVRMTVGGQRRRVAALTRETLGVAVHHRANRDLREEE